MTAAAQRVYRLRNRVRLNAEQRAHRKADPEYWRRIERVKKGRPEPTRPEPVRCECCGGPPLGNRKHLDVDHDHVTGKFRGWLCGRCNRGIGMLGDTVKSVLRAAAYLTRRSTPN